MLKALFITFVLIVIGVLLFVSGKLPDVSKLIVVPKFSEVYSIHYAGVNGDVITFAVVITIVFLLTVIIPYAIRRIRNMRREKLTQDAYDREVLDRLKSLIDWR